MIEVTEEMLAAFLAAWDHENRVINESEGEYVEAGARDRAGLVAVLALVEREQVAPLRAVLEKLLDPYACHYDHHGDCQEHGTTSQRPCPHARAKDLLGWSAP